MAYRTEAIRMTLSHPQVHSPTASLSNVIFLYSCAPVDKISTDIARHAVPCGSSASCQKHL